MASSEFLIPKEPGGRQCLRPKPGRERHEKNATHAIATSVIHRRTIGERTAAQITTARATTQSKARIVANQGCSRSSRRAAGIIRIRNTNIAATDRTPSSRARSMSKNWPTTPGPGHLAILTFHGFGTPASTISFPPAVLQSGLARLIRKGYQSVDLLDAVELVCAGSTLPPKSLVITIDDGYESAYREAFPTLQEHGMTATIFVTTGRRVSRDPSDRLPPIEGQPMVSWRELNEMVGAGFSVGAHTLTHPDLTRLPRSEAEAEIVGAKTILEERLGVSVRSFAYPRGKYDQQAREIATRYYSCACSDRLGLVTCASDRHALERVEMYYFSRGAFFNLLTTPLFPTYLRLRAVPRKARRAWARSR